MKSSIAVGGIVGIVIGAVITFAIAHGVFASEAEPPAQADTPPTPTSALDARPSDMLSPTPHRPLRPGSRRYGKVSQS